VNDNEMSIGPAVGALSAYLNRLKRTHVGVRRDSAEFRREPDFPHAAMPGSNSSLGAVFEELGFHYVGPIDGHDFAQLVPTLEKARDWHVDRPILVHAVTQKGKGYAPALTIPKSKSRSSSTMA
jgi:1-deoxy-D-xylulose-5-phosphate synthase